MLKLNHNVYPRIWKGFPVGKTDMRKPAYTGRWKVANQVVNFSEPWVENIYL